MKTAFLLTQLEVNEIQPWICKWLWLLLKSYEWIWWDWVNDFKKELWYDDMMMQICMIDTMDKDNKYDVEKGDNDDDDHDGLWDV